MGDEERVSGVSDVLVGVLAQVLQLASDRIDRQQSLLNMGIDSLMAMELQMSVESKLGVKVSTLELMKGNNLTQLAQYVSKALIEKAQRKPAKAAASAAAPARTDHAASLIAQIDNLGDAEVDKLLAQLLPKQEIEA
jgi:acyl carrier protein